MASGALRKPQLRGLLTRQIFRNLAITFGLVASTVTALRFYLVQGRKNAYAQYYSTLDTEAMFNEMRKAGVFQSVPPEEPPAPTQEDTNEGKKKGKMN
ncbi:cytochrome c oxidase subunit 6C-like isoform X2 [Chrysoperla carnea]|nr:cytochrome c oxidase subunit 6C-like isoform X2 [Chrysoperla carnea]